MTARYSRSVPRTFGGARVASFLLIPFLCGRGHLAVAEDDLVPNPSFESSTEGWTSWQGGLSRARLASTPSGQYAARVAHTTGTAYSIDDSASLIASVAAGTSYDALAYVRSASPGGVGKPITLVRRERNPAGVVVASWPSERKALTTRFQPLSALGRPSAGNALDVYVIQEDAESGDAFYVNAITVATSSSPSASPEPVGQEGGDWSLIFRDEFQGTSLDATKWVTCFPWGGSAGCGSTTTPQMWYLPKNVIVGGGKARLRALRKPVTVNGNTYPYSSGMLTTAGFSGLPSYKFLATYAYVEMRARVPRGKGLWPAFWLLPPEGAWPPEIDVMEILGDDTNTTHMHFHYRDEGGAHRDSGGSWTGPDFAAGWHTFAVSWEADAIRWYVDGVERRTAFVATRFIASEDMYLLANLQVGGDWPGLPDSSTPFPSYYDIDYIRVWQR